MRYPSTVQACGSFRPAHLLNPATISRHIQSASIPRRHAVYLTTTTIVNSQLIFCLNDIMTTLLGTLFSALSPVVTHSRLFSPIRSGSTLYKTLLTRPFSYDHVIIGAGVVGLAAAAKLAEYTRSTFPTSS